MVDFRSVVKVLSNTITGFKNNQKKWDIVLKYGNNMYKEDFSVLLKQNIIDTLYEIHESKEKILAGILVLMTEVQNKNNQLSGIYLPAIENIRNNAYAVASIELHKSIIDYGTQVNQSIEFFKTTDGQIYENQLSEADKILNLWQKILTEVNEIIQLIQSIENNVLILMKY